MPLTETDAPDAPAPTPAFASPLALAIDVGGTKVESALVAADATVLAGTRHRAPTGAGSSADEIADAVGRVIDATLAATPPGSVIAGAGIGCAGPISIERGSVSPLNLHAWRDFPLAELVRERSGLDHVVLRLDGLCILLAELWAGALQGSRNAMGLVVSTGIGGGLLLEGKLMGGRTGNAGHVGQIQLHTRAADSHGLDLSVTLEGIAAGPNIVSWAREHGFAGTSGEELGAAAAAGDPLARAAIERSAHAVGEGIASVCALVDLEAVAIGGGFSKVSPDYIDLVQAAVDEVAPLSTIPGVRVLPSALSGDGPLIGASGLVHHPHYLP
ncbi:ROK family protein [Herbiconiux sp. KACC 21604]|uniref:ROK family protein n=1 Tax=unclassified Herbiconiux TaxID=2618217 RepID=UPI001490E551|nr:ROK family protein [Herbiconiux sp. SALV-R1]QJU53080.1 ROK family protein [Herbiconiux sp. SALV-R1]WPO88012.1 ROK family protein [Herbiconiux sp. KACC 21604]